jgi:hypothetical protein
MVLEGPLETWPEVFQHELSRHALLRSGWLNFSSRLLLDRLLFSAKGVRYDLSVEDLRRRWTRAALEGPLSQAEVSSLLLLLNRAAGDRLALRRAVEQVRSLATGVFGTVAGTMAMSGSLGAGAPTWLMVLAGLGASAFARVRAGFSLEGSTYNLGSLRRDLLLSRPSSVEPFAFEHENPLRTTGADAWFPFVALSILPANEPSEEWEVESADHRKHRIRVFRGESTERTAQAQALLKLLAQNLPHSELSTLEAIRLLPDEAG